MNVSLRRSLAAIAAVATTTLGGISAIAPATATVFAQQEVDQGKFIAVAAPIRGGSAHQLLVLEQVSSTRPCWSEAAGTPVQVDPLLVNFDFTGICGRSVDSNGYSIRANQQDLGLQYSLRVVERNGDMLLVGAPNNRNAQEIVIGETNGVTPGFAKINLEPGWRFTKRSFDGRTLGHVYLTYDGDIAANPNPGNTGGTPNNGNTNPQPPVNNPRFRDTANDIYAKEIDQAVQLGFVSGFSEDNTFRPQESLTREQLVSMVLESLKKLPNVNLNIPTQAVGNPYSDVSGSRWSAAKIQFARDNNIVSGYQDGSFRPAQPVTRAELMAVLRRAAEYGQSLQGRGTQLQPKQEVRTFSDTGSHWAAPLIGEMSSYCGVASPLNESGSAFAPDSPARRNYAAAATLRMLNCVKAQ